MKEEKLVVFIDEGTLTEEELLNLHKEGEEDE